MLLPESDEWWAVNSTGFHWSTDTLNGAIRQQICLLISNEDGGQPEAIIGPGGTPSYEGEELRRMLDDALQDATASLHKQETA